MAVVTELITEFSFQGSTAPLSEFNKDLGGAINLLGKMATAITGISGLMQAFVMETFAGADAVGQLALSTGIGVEVIQELGFAASISGSDVETLNDSLFSFSEKIGEVAQLGANEDFDLLGISVKDANGQVKTADVLFTELGKRFRELKLSKPEQIGFLMRLGIDRSLVQLIAKTGDEMDAMREKARSFGLVSEEQQKKILEFNDTFTILRFGIEAIQKQVAIGLSPAFKEMAEQFTDFITTNKDLITNVLTGFGEGVTVVIQALDRLKFLIGGVIAGFIAWKVATVGLGAVLSVVLSPVYLITAAIVAILVIIDDLIVAMRGGKSVIRDFFLEFFDYDIVPFIQDIIESFKQIGIILGETFKGIWALITGDFDGFIEHIRNAFTEVINYIKSLFRPIQGILETTGEFLGLTGGDDQQPATQPRLTFGNTVFPVGGTQQTQNQTVNQTVQIDVATNDPLRAANAVNDGLQNQLENANTQFNRGGR